MEGPHIRLRLLPAAGVDRDALARRAIAVLEEFLSRRSALYEEDRNDSDELYRNMFIAEYSAAEWDERHGPDGRMPFRLNNSIAEMEYEREFSRYGGPDAIELAERHFEFSSEEVTRTLATTSVHLRTILLGQAVQQTLALSFAMLGTANAVRSFLLDYRIMWETSYQEPSEGQHEGFDRSFLAMRDRLVGRVEHIRVSAGRPSPRVPANVGCAMERSCARPSLTCTVRACSDSGTECRQISTRRCVFC